MASNNLCQATRIEAHIIDARWQATYDREDAQLQSIFKGHFGPPRGMFATEQKRKWNKWSIIGWIIVIAIACAGAYVFGKSINII